MEPLIESIHYYSMKKDLWYLRKGISWKGVIAVGTDVNIALITMKMFRSLNELS